MNQRPRSENKVHRTSFQTPETMAATADNMVSQTDDKFIVCGRGKRFAMHHGNQRFVGVIRQSLGWYSTAPTRSDKSLVVSTIRRVLQQSGYIFVKLDTSRKGQTERWTPLAPKACHVKIGHAIRDQMNYLKQVASEKSCIPISVSKTKREIGKANMVRKHHKLDYLASLNDQAFCPEAGEDSSKLDHRKTTRKQESRSRPVMSADSIITEALWISQDASQLCANSDDCNFCGIRDYTVTSTESQATARMRANSITSSSGSSLCSSSSSSSSSVSIDTIAGEGAGGDTWDDMVRRVVEPEEEGNGAHIFASAEDDGYCHDSQLHTSFFDPKSHYYDTCNGPKF